MAKKQIVPFRRFNGGVGRKAQVGIPPWFFVIGGAFNFCNISCEMDSINSSLYTVNTSGVQDKHA